ncbi:MAG: 7-carboxy-7-deazaguanine synthase QueE [Gammaproteobacteria bacterium]|jgi:7-carboxy-7-deazaguanine synthase
MTEKLRITEIFYSLQGEARTVGLPTVFVRLTGCPLRCGYCDTAYAFSGGMLLSIEEILTTVAAWSPHYVCVTGGEPLAQKACWPLLAALCEQGYAVSLETSGAIDVSGVDARVSKVLDIKTPGSGEMHRNIHENLARLLPTDQIKFVITDAVDYDWSKARLAEYALTGKVSDILFSPVHGQLEPSQLAEWILRDRLPVRLQIQLHKYLWADAAGR